MDYVNIKKGRGWVSDSDIGSNNSYYVQSNRAYYLMSPYWVWTFERIDVDVIHGYGNLSSTFLNDTNGGVQKVSQKDFFL